MKIFRFSYSILDQLPLETWNLVRKARQVVDNIIDSKKGSLDCLPSYMLISIFYAVVYGINTGFGSFASKIIPDDKLG